ncbi:hypothetical protein BC834DRAFT_890978 [Gloeopeniophorella convolvens]|nr:hypothetical protein BC834DRAFT_890978 [Gloeopeniophorella convolvens]
MKPRMSTSPPPLALPDDDTEEDEDGALDRTIGRVAGRHAATPLRTRTATATLACRAAGTCPPATVGNGDEMDTSTGSLPASTSPPRRPHAQTGAGAGRVRQTDCPCPPVSPQEGLGHAAAGCHPQ